MSYQSEEDYHLKFRVYREKKPLTIKVLVFDIATGQQIREHTCNLLLSEKKIWLYNLMMWATMNGKSIEIFNLKDDKSE